MLCDPGGGLVGLIYISKRSGVHPATRLSNHGIGLQGCNVSSWSRHCGCLHHGLGRTKVGAWMPRTVGGVLAHSGVGHLAQGLLKNVMQKIYIYMFLGTEILALKPQLLTVAT